VILGVGIDLIEVERIRKIYDRYKAHFLERVYTEDEVSYCIKKGVHIYECLAGRFAAKEAVIKATGGRIKSYKKIEILDTKYGPMVRIEGNANYRLMVSISHIKNLAMAIAIWEE